MTKEFFERGKQIAEWADKTMTKDETLKMRVEQDEQWEKVINRKWQGLTDDEIGRLAVFDGLHHVEIPLLAKFILAIEQALKDKNT
jgi:hypothetical protein